MSKRKLTESLVEDLADGQVLIWDAAQPGLCVRRQSTAGKVTFVVRYRTATGTQRTHTLGRSPAMSVKEARAAAKVVLAAVAQQKDSAAEKSRAVKGRTLTELWAAYEPFLQPRSDRTAAGYLSIWRRLIEPTLGSQRVAQITDSDVLRFQNLHKRTPRQANHALAVLSLLMNFSVKNGDRPDNPVKGIALLCHHVMV